ncbi:tRNA pseudouridine(55) synthase TruB [bacterium]|nr:tRNA pseudouridine(55) synthase TruB [bacterium]
MDGLINIYKPKGMTSFDVIRFLRKQTGIKKIGHIGTLDPSATGVLVIAIGQATKLIEFMMDHDKKYEAEILLGKRSSTYDSEGEILEGDSQKPSNARVSKVINSFIGKTEQVPPVYSALKMGGKPAYKRARAGEEIKMKKRKIIIYSIDLEDYSYPLIKLKIYCGTGTYIRSLANDIGEKLGVGAYLSSLTRTSVGNFSNNRSFTLEEIEKNGVEKYLLPIGRAVVDMEHVILTEREYSKLRNGMIIEKKLPKGIDICAAIFNNNLVGIIEKTDVKNFIKFKKQISLA